MSRPSKPVPITPILIIGGLAWSVLALLFFLLFSVPLPGQELPGWYSIGTYVFELGAWLMSTFLCFRNWLSAHMVSGRKVWLCLGLGMLSYFIAGLLFGVWELVFGLDPDVSPADAFYLASYLFLALGMIFAVTSKRLMLEPKQWGILAGVGIAGTALAIVLTAPTLFGTSGNKAFLPPVLTVASAPQNLVSDQGFFPEIVAAKPSPQPKSPPVIPKKNEEQEEENENTKAPAWVVKLNEQLQPYSYPVNLFYIVGDIVLLIIATALLLAFWGGRFSQSWRMIAAATFCLYIADMYSKWRSNLPESVQNFQSGSWPEVFFVFGAVLFGIGALLEHDISLASRRGGRRRGR
jgi:hypothetical protein